MPLIINPIINPIINLPDLNLHYLKNCCADSVVLDALSQALHPEHGSLIMNLHGGGLPTAARFAAALALLTSCLPFAPKGVPSGYHHSTQKGQAVQHITKNLR